MHSSLELKREVEAVQIPSGDMITLPIGMKVIITQSLGGTYTVATDLVLTLKPPRKSRKAAPQTFPPMSATSKARSGISSRMSMTRKSP
jgi:hypothetical protein